MTGKCVRKACFVLAASALWACAGSDAEGPSAEEARDPLMPRSENHAHIRSEAGADLLFRISEAVGQDTGDDPGGAIDAERLIAALDSVGVERAQVLSVAYFFGFPDLDVEGREEGMRAENDWVAGQVARFPDRLLGACSVNPLDTYAPAEVQRCADDPRLVGLKLHFANSAVDLRDPDHVSRVADVFRVAGDNDLPIVAHMRTRAPDYGARDVRAFIDGVLSQAPDLPVQLAHMAGWGGYDAPTDEALVTFIEAFASGALDRELYTFDLAAVAVPPELAGADTAMVQQLEAANALLSQRILELGTDRVVYATDWSALAIGAYAASLRESLSLSVEELADVMDNVGPMVRAAEGGE